MPLTRILQRRVLRRRRVDNMPVVAMPDRYFDRRDFTSDGVDRLMTGVGVRVRVRIDEHTGRKAQYRRVLGAAPHHRNDGPDTTHPPIVVYRQ